MKIRWTGLAELDLRDAVEHIAADDPAAALATVDRILDAVELLADGRFDGPSATLTGGETVRLWVVAPFTVIYRRRDEAVEVLRVYHGRRRPVSNRS